MALLTFRSKKAADGIDTRDKWLAVHIKGKDPRVEVRKTMGDYDNYAQVCMTVRPDGVQIASTGIMSMTHSEFADMVIAAGEAYEMLPREIK